MKLVFFPEDGQPAEVHEWDGAFDTLTTLVDGDVEPMRLLGGLVLLCDTDGLLLELEPNRVVPPALSGFYDVWRSTIRGPFVIVKDGVDDFEGLSDAEVARILAAFGEPVPPELTRTI